MVLPDAPWKRIHVDFFGPFWLLVVVDAHSKWTEAVPTNQSCTSATTITKLRSIFATFGIPEMLVSDNGAAFTSTEFENFMTKNGIRHLTTAPYHAASNGLAERAVQTVTQGLLKQPQGDVMAKLSRFLLSYRITAKGPTGFPPAELMFGRRLRTRLDLLQPNIEERVHSKQAAMKDRYDRNTQQREFTIGVPVYTRLPSSEQWQLATVVGNQGQIVTLEFPDGRALRRHKDNVRLRTMGTETRPNQEAGDGSEQDILQEQSSMRIDPSLNERPPRIEPHQETVNEEEVEIINEDEVNSYESIDIEEKENNIIVEENVKDEPAPLRRSTRVRRPVEIYQAGSN